MESRKDTKYIVGGTGAHMDLHKAGWRKKRELFSPEVIELEKEDEEYDILFYFVRGFDSRYIQPQLDKEYHFPLDSFIAIEITEEHRPKFDNEGNRIKDETE